MAKTEQEIITDILNHIKNEGSSFSKWYVGIASDIKKRLFGDHKVPEKDHWFIYRNASSSDVARKIEKHFIDKHGTSGGPGGGDNTTTYVYAYKMTSITEP